MVMDLRELLHRSVEAPPPGALELDRLIDAGARRVRRRRLTVGSVAAAVVVAAVLAPFLLPRIGSSGPVAPVEPVGRVVHLSDARPMQPGKDVRILYSQRTGNLDRANGTSIGPVLDDGRVLVQDGPHGIHNISRWGLLNPVTGTTTWFPRVAAADGPGELVGYDDRRLLMSTGSSDGRHLVLWSLDRATRRWTRISLDMAPLGLRGQDALLGIRGAALDRGRYWFGVQPSRGANHSDLWSASLTGSHAIRDEHLDVGTWDLHDGVLVSMRYDNRPTSRMQVRDLTAGTNRTFDTRSGRHCNQLGMKRIGENVVLMQYCGTHDGRRDDRAQVVTLTGAPVVTLQDDSIDVDGDSARYVSVTCYRNGHEGTYVWDLARERFLQISDGFSHFAGRRSGHGDRLLWSTPILNGHGQDQWVGDLR